MLSIGDRVTDDVLKEDFENTTSLLIDKAGDTLHTTTTSKTADSLRANARRTMRMRSWRRHAIRTGLVMPWMLSRKILR